MPTQSQAIELGVSCPDFNLPSVSGDTISLQSLERVKILVVAFTCNHCPYVQAYEDRMNELSRKFDIRGVKLLCINSNDAENYPDDSFEKMKERAKEKSFHFIYARDESQEVAKSFDAACTPEFFVFDRDRLLRYHGRLDDNYQDPVNVQEKFLEAAIEDLLADRPVRNPQTHAIGCSIKWK